MGDMRTWKKFVIGALLALLAVSVAVYFGAVRSEAYQVACNFVRSNPVIESRLGKVEKCRLNPLGWRIAYGGPNGVANFGLNVAGDKGEGEVFLDMKTDLGEWKVTGAKLRLQDGSFVKVQ
jgi:Cytochrome oxidase complex assembly protein 1